MPVLHAQILHNGSVYCFSDVLKVLQDLKETSLHSVDILKHFVVRFYFYDMITYNIITFSLNCVELFKILNQKVVSLHMTSS